MGKKEQTPDDDSESYCSISNGHIEARPDPVWGVRYVWVSGKPVARASANRYRVGSFHHPKKEVTKADKD